MKIPNEIKIGGLVYRIIITDSDNIDDDAGECNVLNQTIKINKNLSSEGKEFALWHEIIHAWNSSLDDDEKVDAIAQMISTIINDNDLYD